MTTVSAGAHGELAVILFLRPFFPRGLSGRRSLCQGYREVGRRAARMRPAPAFKLRLRRAWSYFQNLLGWAATAQEVT